MSNDDFTEAGISPEARSRATPEIIARINAIKPKFSAEVEALAENKRPLSSAEREAERDRAITWRLLGTIVWPLLEAKIWRMITWSTLTSERLAKMQERIEILEHRELQHA